MERERQTMEGFQVDGWFIVFKLFFFCLDIALLFSNLFFSCLIFPQLWQYTWSQMWVHYLKMPAVEVGKKVGKNHQRNLWSLGQRQKTHQYCTSRAAGTLIEKIKLQVRKSFTFLLWSCHNGLLLSIQNPRKNNTPKHLKKKNISNVMNLDYLIL